MRLGCIINPRAGRHPRPDAIADELRQTALRHGWHIRIRCTRARDEASEIAEELVATSDAIVAAGGDGTVHEVASALVGSQIPLAIIPCGSGNGFARSLGIPLETSRAIQLVADSAITRLDVGVVNDHYFFATAGIGLDAEISHRFATGHHARGIWPYFSHGLAAWCAYKPETVSLRMADDVQNIAPLLIAVANTEQYGGGAKIAPGASPSDHLLNITVVQTASVFRLLSALPRLFDGSLGKSRLVSLHTATDVVIERSAPGLYHLDGEHFMGPAILRFSILPAALHVHVPTPTTQSHKIGTIPSVHDVDEK